MKTFNRVLALLLALIMTVAVLPLSILADKWVEVEADKTQSGNVATSDVTLSLDPDAFAAYLKDRDWSGLLSGVSVSGLGEIVSLEELYAIVPEEVWKNILSTIGEEVDTNTLLSLVDLKEMMGYVDVDKLLDLVLELKNLQNYVKDFDALMSYITNIDPALDYVDKYKLLSENADELMDLVLALSDSTLISLVDVKKVSELQGIDFGAVINMVYIRDTVGYENLLTNYVDLESVDSRYLDDDAMDALVSALNPADITTDYVDMKAIVTAYFTGKSYSELKPYVDTNKLIAEVKGLEYSKLSSYINETAASDIIRDLAPQLVTGSSVDVASVWANLPENVINVMINGDSTHSAAINATAMLLGSAPLFTFDALLSKGIVDTDMALYGNGSNVAPLFTVSELVSGGYADVKLAVVGDSERNIPALISISQLVAANAVNITALVTDEVVNIQALGAVYGYENLADIAALKTDIRALPDKTVLINCLKDSSGAAAIKAIGLSKAVSAVGGYKVLIEKYVTDFGGMIKALGFETIFDDIIAGGKITQILNVPGLVSAIGVRPLVQLVDVKGAFKHLYKNDELVPLLKDLKDILADVDYDKVLTSFVPVLNELTEHVDGLTINGQKVAAEDSLGLLGFDSAALLKALADAIPTLGELATIGDDGVVMQLQVGLTYASDATGNEAKTKIINLTVVLESGVDTVRKLAQKLSDLMDRFLSYSYADGKLTLGITIPAKASSMLRVVLEKLDSFSPALQDEILKYYSGNLNDLVGFINNLTLEQILDIFQAMDADDFRAAYNRVLSVEYVQVMLDYLERVTDRDLSGITPDEIIAKSANLPTMLQIAEAIEAKLGVDVLSKISLSSKLDKTATEIFEALASKAGVDVDLQAILKEAAAADDPVQALYDAVLAKIEASNDLYVSIKNRVLSYMNRILASEYGQKLADVRLSDIYEGGGVFQAEGSFTVNPKALIERGFDSLIARLPDDTNIDQLDRVYAPLVRFLKSETMANAWDLLLSYFSGGSVSLTVDATVRVNGMYAISFYDQTGENLLFTTFLPEGTDLSKIFEMNDSADFDFTGWVDKDNADIAYTHMPSKDVSVKANGDYYYTITLVDAEGTVLLTIPAVKLGTLLGAYQDQLEGAVALPTDPLYTYVYGWQYQIGADEWAEIALDTPVTADLTLKLDPKVDPSKTALRIDGVDHTILEDGQGNYSVLINALPDAFELHMEKHFVEYVIGLNGSIAVKTADERFAVTMTTETLEKLMSGFTSETYVRYRYASKANGTLYATIAGAAAFEMGFLYGDATEETPTDLTGCGLTVTMPFDTVADTSAIKTYVSTSTAGVREDIAATLNAANKTVTFVAPHFSEFAIVNKYNLSLNTNYKLQSGTTLLDKTSADAIAESPIVAGYYAAGEVLQIKDSVSLLSVTGFVAANHEWVKTLYTDGTNNGELTLGGTFVMPAAAVTLTHVVKSRAASVYYYVAGELVDQVVYDAATFALKALPNGYTKWYGYDASKLGVEDLYLFAMNEASEIVYTVEFYLNETDTTPATTLYGSAADLRKQLSSVPNASDLPNAPADKAGRWVDATGKALESYDWNATLTGPSKTIKFYADYSERTYAIVTDGNVTVDANGSVAAGTTVKVTYEYRIGLVSYNLTVLNMGTGTEIPVTPTLNGTTYEATFTMPAADVRITLEITPSTLTYVDANGNTVTGTVGDFNTFTVTIPAGYTLTENVTDVDGIPATSTLISSVLDANGNMILTYQWTLTAPVDLKTALEAVDACIEQLGYQVYYILNGKAYSAEADAVAALTAEGATLKGWKPLSKNFMLAILEYQPEEGSLLALWIILGILLFVLIVVILYVLYINGKLKPNFILRFVVWLVSGFYAVCKAVAAAGLFIAGLFGYHEDDLAKPDDTEIVYVPTAESTEETPAEEVTEETAEEVATEEATEEAATEEVTEEVATEEVTEEVATEEVTEEAAAEETTEEAAAEEVTEEAAAEEVTEEAAAEEVAEEAAAEEVTEEVAAEEVTEEAAAEEVTEEVAAEEVTEEAAAEEVAEEAATEEATEEVATEEVTEEAAAEEVTEEVATEEVTEEVATEEVTEEAATEETTEEAAAEEVTEEAAAEEVTEEAAAEETAEEATPEETND